MLIAELDYWVEGPSTGFMANNRALRRDGSLQEHLCLGCA